MKNNKNYFLYDLWILLNIILLNIFINIKYCLLHKRKVEIIKILTEEEYNKKIRIEKIEKILEI